MSDSPSIIISQDDFYKISALLSVVKIDIANLLEEELGRATLVKVEDLPSGTVAMNSEVVFTDLDSGKEQTLTLVYPHEANIEQNKISILAPVGAALIGLRVGQEIEWPIAEGRSKRIKVVSVTKSAT